MTSRKKLKAQSMIFEQALIFVITIIIFIITFAVFSAYTDFYNSLSVTDGVYQVRNVVSSNVMKIAQKEGNVESSITLPIPKKVGDQPYLIYFQKIDGKDKLVIELPSTEEKVISNLGYIGEEMSIQFEEIDPAKRDAVKSTKGKVVIYKKGDRIKLI